MKIKLAVASVLLATVFGLPAIGTSPLPKEVGVRLTRQFISEPIRASYIAYGHPEMLEMIEDENWQPEPGLAYPGLASFTELFFPNDTRQYVLLYYTQYGGSFYWRLVGSNSTGEFELLQDGEGWYSLANNTNMLAWQTDLDSDGIPEVLILSSEPEAMECCHIFAWRSNRLVRISPADVKIAPKGETVVSGPLCNDVDGLGIHLEDLDGDRKAEIIVGSEREAIWTKNPEGGENRTWKWITPIRVFHLVNGAYEFWRESPADDPYPISVPSIALLHPGTVPFSELIRFEQDRQARKANASGSDEGLRVFISHPAGQATVDDFETNAFVCDGQGLSFQKRWPNAKQPDTTSANWEWGGCPIHQAPCAKGEAAKGSTPAAGEGACAHWNFSPEDPFMPSPDKKMEYHFVGPYLELRLPKAAVYPFVYRAALDAFTKEPSRTEYFAEVPISGKMKNGKLAAVSALVCVERTGNEKIATPATPSAPAAKETPAQPSATPAPATPAATEPIKTSPETK